MGDKNDRTFFGILMRIAAALEDIDVKLGQLLPKKAVSATLILKGAGMPATIHVNGNGAKAVFTEFDGPNGTGNQVPPVGAISFSSDAPAVATVDAQGNVTAVSAGTANISGMDAGNNLAASDVLTVTADVAVSATLVLTAN